MRRSDAQPLVDGLGCIGDEARRNMRIEHSVTHRLAHFDAVETAQFLSMGRHQPRQFEQLSLAFAAAQITPAPVPSRARRLNGDIDVSL